MGDGSSIEERAKIKCGVCGVLWISHPVDTICARHAPKPLHVVEAVLTPFPVNGTGCHASPPTLADAWVAGILRGKVLRELYGIFARLAALRADLEAVPERGDRLNVAIHGVGLAGEFVEREIERLRS